MRLLLVEDAKKLSAAVCAMLRKANYTVDTAYDGEHGLDMCETDIYDAVILDVMLPGMDGFEILQTMRADGIKTPVLMLTARGGVEDRVRGLEYGADYYLPKPFQVAELLACLKVITRRGESLQPEQLSYGGLTLRQEDGKLGYEASGESIRLGAKEYQLMELFLRNPAQILPKDMLAERVWGLDDESEYNQLEVYISFLRKKLQFLTSEVVIQTRRGMGYSLEKKND